MKSLEELLSEEETAFRTMESFLRQFAVHVRGLRDEHLEPLILGHLKDCSEYFSIHGTIDGPLSPWMIGNREDFYGSKKTN